MIQQASSVSTAPARRLLCGIVLAALAGCGQKGALVLPAPPADAAVPPAAAASAPSPRPAPARTP